MARVIIVRSIPDCLNDGAYREIYNNYPTLSVNNALLILNHSHVYDNQNINDLIKLIKEKVMPTLQFAKVNLGKQKVRQLKRDESNKFVDVDDAEDAVLPLIKYMGCSYKLIGDCYNYIGDITSAIHNYTKAERCGIDCGQEIGILNASHPTPNLNRIVAEAKYIKCSTHQQTAQEITFYAHTIIDDILQLSIAPLSDDIHDNLRTAFATYLRNEVAGVIDNPPMINLASSFEKMLKELFYIPYAKYLDDHEKNSKISPACNRLRGEKIASGNVSFLKFGSNFTLGHIKHLMVESIDNGVYNIDSTFYNFITKYYHIDTNQFGENDFAELVKFTEMFRNSIRNPVGHGVVIHKRTFEHICEELLLKKDSWVDKIVKMTNLDYLQLQNTRMQNVTSFIARRVDSRMFDIEAFAWQLQDFVDKYGRYPKINGRSKLERQMAKRVYTIRLFNNGINKLDLNERHIGILDEIGFVWNDKIDWFDDFCAHLLQYKNEHGTLDIPARYITRDGKHLGQQVNMIRKGTIKLTPDQSDVLQNLGFELNSQSTNTKWFDKFYQELVEYKAVYGNFENVMYDKILGPQIMAFAGDYSRTKQGRPTQNVITKEMLLKLIDIGFISDKKYKKQNDNTDEYDLTR